MPRVASLILVAICWLPLTGTAAAEAPLAPHLLTAGDSVRAAFREVVAKGRPWTVRIRVGESPAALGLIVREDGHILTKGSQLLSETLGVDAAMQTTGTAKAPPAEDKDANKIFVKLYDRPEREARVVAFDSARDLALLKIDATQLPIVQWAEEPLAVGIWVATPGHAPTPVGVGVIAVLPRRIPHVSGVLGVRLADGPGAPVIVQVFGEGGGAAAGLKENDEVLKINGATVANRGEMISRIQSQQPGDVIELELMRDDQTLTLKARLTHPFGQMLSRIGEQNMMGGMLSHRRGDFPLALQHDTVLKPEDCGGPILDLEGRAVGVNIARAGRTETFAIPASEARKSVAEMLSGKHPLHVKTDG